MAYIFELQTGCLQAGEDKADAELVYQAIRRERAKQGLVGIDSDPAVLIALADRDKAQAAYDAALAAYSDAKTSAGQDA